MAFCPECGAATNHTMTFCTACGATLPATPPVAAVPGATATPAIPAGPPRPVGKTVSPVAVILLPLVTFGIYPLVFWWRTTREIDAYAGANAHRLGRAGVILSAIGLLLSVAVIAPVVVAYVQVLLESPADASIEPSFLDEYLASPFFGPMIAASIGGSLLIAGAAWRLGNALRADEQMRNVANLYAAPVVLGILIVYAILPSLAIVLPSIEWLSFAAGVAAFWVYYTTQRHLNDAWKATPPAPAPPQPAAP